MVVWRKLLLSEGEEEAFKKEIAKNKQTNIQTNKQMEEEKQNSILEAKCKSTNKASKVK